MSRPESHARYEELAAGMALHALEPADEQDFLAHLTGCAPCERDLLEHQAVLGQLAYAAEAVEPPPAILEGIRAGMLASGRQVSHPDDPVPTTAAPSSSSSAPVSLDDVRKRREERGGRRATWAGAAAAAALVVSLGVWSADLRDERDDQARLSAELASTLQRLEDPSTQTVRLQGGSGDVVAVALVSGSEVELVLDGLPVNDDATSYVLWGEAADGSRQAVGAFDVTSANVEVRRGMQMDDGVARLMVTREQGDTAPEVPTLPVLAVGEV